MTFHSPFPSSIRPSQTRHDSHQAHPLPSSWVARSTSTRTYFVETATGRLQWDTAPGPNGETHGLQGGQLEGRPPVQEWGKYPGGKLREEYESVESGHGGKKSGGFGKVLLAGAGGLAVGAVVGGKKGKKDKTRVQSETGAEFDEESLGEEEGKISEDEESGKEDSEENEDEGSGDEDDETEENESEEGSDLGDDGEEDSEVDAEDEDAGNEDEEDPNREYELEEDGEAEDEEEDVEVEDETD